jgi:hypothetical protein
MTLQGVVWKTENPLRRDGVVDGGVEPRFKENRIFMAMLVLIVEICRGFVRENKLNVKFAIGLFRSPNETESV